MQFFPSVFSLDTEFCSYVFSTSLEPWAPGLSLTSKACTGDTISLAKTGLLCKPATPMLSSTPAGCILTQAVPQDSCHPTGQPWPGWLLGTCHQEQGLFYKQQPGALSAAPLTVLARPSAVTTRAPGQRVPGSTQHLLAVKLFSQSYWGARGWGQGWGAPVDPDLPEKGAERQHKRKRAVWVCFG